MNVVLTTEDFEHFAAAAKHRPTEKVIDVLRCELEATRARNDDLEDIELYRSQGRACLLKELLMIFKDAEEYSAPQQASGIPDSSRF